MEGPSKHFQGIFRKHLVIKGMHIFREYAKSKISPKEGDYLDLQIQSKGIGSEDL